ESERYEPMHDRETAHLVLPALQLAHHILAEPVDRALAGERDQRDLAGLPRLEPHRRAGGDVEPHAARLSAIELQRRVGLEEMIVRAHLDRPVAGVRHRQRHGLAAGIEGDVAGLDEELAGDHVNFLSIVIASEAKQSPPSIYALREIASACFARLA